MQEKGMSGHKITEDRTFPSCWIPSPVTVLEHSSVAESCNSSDSADNHGTGNTFHVFNIFYAARIEDVYSEPLIDK